MHKTIQYLLIIITTISTSLSGQNNVIDEIVAVVGDNIILESDIEKQAIQYRNQGYFSEGNIKCEMIEDLLYQKLLINQAKIDSIEVTENMVNSEIDRRIQYFIAQLGSEEKLEDFYGKSILEIKEEFRSVIKDQMISQQMQMELTKDIDVTPTDVRKFYNDLSKDSLPVINTTLELQQIVLHPYISEADILAVKERLQGFKKRIEAGEQFATLAVLYSEDKGTATKGGKLGYVGRNDLVPEFAAVAFKLEKGQVSRIVKTEYGYHIIQMIDRKGEKINVRHILLKPQVKAEIKQKTLNKLDSIRTKIMKDTLTWEEAVTVFSDDKDTKQNNGTLINHMTGSAKFEKSQIEPSIAYAIKDLDVGEISKPFETFDQTGKKIYKIVKINKKTESHTANLIDDYKEIQELALQEKKEEFIKEWVKDKRNSTYIRIDDAYKDCKFRYNWLK